MAAFSPAGGVTWITPETGFAATPPATLQPSRVLTFLSTLPGVVPPRVAAVQATPGVATLLAMATAVVLMRASPVAQQITPATTA